MEPYIKLMNTDFDEKNLRFTDKVQYDGYDFSFVVSSMEIEKLCSDLDYLFQIPAMSNIPNIANMTHWHFTFFDHTGHACRVRKLGEYIYFLIPHYKPIRTGVSSGIAYLRIFNDTAHHLLQRVHEPLNTAHITDD